MLRVQNAEKDKQLAYLESRVADLEQYTRVNDVIITGLQVKPRSYARAVTPDGGKMTAKMDVNSTEQQAVAFLQSKGVELNGDTIEACHHCPGETPLMDRRSSLSLSVGKTRSLYSKKEGY